LLRTHSSTVSLLPFLQILLNVSRCYIENLLNSLGPLIVLQEDKFVVRSPWPEVEIPETNLADFVWQDVSQHAEYTALVGILWQVWFSVREQS
jgi:hypothetical protein